MEPTPNLPAIRALRPAWNKGRIVGQKQPLKPKHVWAIRVRLELAHMKHTTTREHKQTGENGEIGKHVRRRTVR